MNDTNTIQQIFNNQKITITPIIGRGSVNKVYSIEQPDKKLIIRLNNEHELGRFTKEAWCMQQAINQGIPSPHLLDIGSTNNTAYMILNFVAGTNGKDILTDQEKIWYTIGSYAKKIHSFSTSGFGENMTSPGTFSDTWERYLTYNIDSLDSHDQLLELETISEKESQLIRDKFIALREKKFTFSLVHGDLSLENVIVHDDEVTLIDWGVAEATIVPHLEIIDLLQNQLSDDNPLFDSFLEGYGLTRKDYVALQPDIAVLALLQAIDKLRWAIDKKPDQIDPSAKRVKTLVEKLIENYVVGN